LIVHSSQYDGFLVPDIVSRVITQGARGVQLFYLVSAFTIFMSYHNHASERHCGLNFFIRRFFRIAPLWYISIGFYVLFQKDWQNMVTVSWRSVIGNITFLHGFNPYWINYIVPGGWSVGVGVIFYMFTPILYRKIKTVNQAFNLFIASVVINYLLLIFFKFLMRISAIVPYELWNNFLFFYFPSNFPVFVLGIIAYYLIKERALENISNKSLLLFTLLLLLFLATGTQTHVLFGVCFLLLTVSLSDGKIAALVNPVLCHIGKISFSMYLIHNAILYYLRKLAVFDQVKNGMLKYCLYVTILLCITVPEATISYTLIEIPFQKIGKKITAKLSG